MTTMRRAAAGDRERALRSVVAAFAAEPVLRWVWPGQERYDACAPGFFGLLLDLRLEAGEVWLVDDGDAVAMWDPPGGLYLRPAQERWDQVRAGFTDGERALWDEFDSRLSIPGDSGPYWFLGVLATDPRRQGQGLGRAVVAPMLAAADRTGLPAFLETSEVNVGFYQRLGFVPLRQVELPDGGPRCFLMRRDPGEQT